MKVKFNGNNSSLFTYGEVYKVIFETRNTYILYSNKGTRISMSKSKFTKLKWFQGLFK